MNYLICFILFYSVQTFAQGQAKKSFEEVLEISLKQSEDVASKESEQRSYDTVLLQSKYKFVPDLSLTGTYSEYGEDVQNRSLLKTYGLQSNLNLYKFGADVYSYKAADAALQSSKWEVRSTLLSQEELVATKLLDLIAKHQEVEIRQKLFLSQKEYTSVAERRYEKGILPRQELNKVTIDFQIAEAKLKDAQLAEYQAYEALKVYSGEVNVEMSWPWLQKLKSFKKHALNFSLQNHPAWKAQKSTLDSADYKLKNKNSELWPSLDLSVTYLNQYGATTSNRWTPAWTGLVTLTIPLFNHYENMSAAKVAFETKYRADLTLQKNARELEAVWKTAQRDFEVQIDSAIQREKTLKMSRGLYDDNYERFKAGRSNANDLFNDQERLYQTELLAVEGWYAVHLSYIKLCHSMGLMTYECHFE